MPPGLSFWPFHRVVNNAQDQHGVFIYAINDSVGIGDQHKFACRSYSARPAAFRKFRKSMRLRFDSLIDAESCVNIVRGDELEYPDAIFKGER